MISSNAPIIPTKMLTNPEELDQTLQSAGYQANNAAAAAAAAAYMPLEEEQMEAEIQIQLPPTHIEVVTVNNAINHENNILISPASMNLSHSQIISQYSDTPETESYEVELRKNVYGLGITVAGYVCEEEELSGIFVKSIIEGSAAELSRKININDRIVAVDGKSLSGVSNYQAVEILRNTDIAVNLTLERFLRGRKYEHLQVALVEGKEEGSSQKSLPASPSVTTLSYCQAKSDADSITTECGECGEIEGELDSCGTADSNSVVENGNDDDYDCDGRNGDREDSNNNDDRNDESTEEMKVETPTPTPSLSSIARSWQKDLDDDYRVIVAEVNKLSGLGISLEGTVDVESGIELRPHHYIRSILIEGPVGKDGKLAVGDELLQVNEHKLQGLRHTDVVKIIKNLPENVKIVCARGSVSRSSIINTSQNPEAFEARSILSGGLQGLCLTGMLTTKALSESSLYTSSTATITDQHQRSRSRSMEQISGLALWTDEVTYVDVEKTEKGFGFSILDYQDPLDNEGTVIVVRGLIPGGSAETANTIFPGDRLVSVNDHDLKNVTLDEAVAILKGIPIGNGNFGICRPLESTSDNNLSSTSITPTT